MTDISASPSRLPAVRLFASALAIGMAVSFTPAKANVPRQPTAAEILAQTQKMLADQRAEFDRRDAERQAQINALQSQVTDLSGQLQAVKTQAATPPPPPTAAQVAAVLPKPDTTVTMKKGTATIASADADYSVAFHGVFQLDSASYDQSKTLPAAVAARDLNSGVNFRRARVGMNGKIAKDFDYNILLDFGGAGAEDVGRFHEAWIQYSGFKSAKIRFGEFAPNVGLADAGSTNASPFLERPASAEVARNVAGGDTRMGLAVFNTTDRWLWSVALTGNTVSQLNTQATSFTAANADEQLGMTARIAGTPFRGFDWLVHTGVNYSAVINPGDAGAAAAVRYPMQLRDRPELRVDGARLIDTGALNAQSASATGVELGGQYKGVYAAAEAFDYDIKRLDPAAGVTNPSFSGWYIEGGWSLTGEARKYNTATGAFDGMVPRANFDPAHGQWGAFELVGRYSTFDLNYHADAATAADRVRGGKQDITTLGLDWQLNPGVRFVFEGQSVKIERLNASGAEMGQKYNAYAVRSQFSF